MDVHGDCAYYECVVDGIKVRVKTKEKHDTSGDVSDE